MGQAVVPVPGYSACGNKPLTSFPAPLADFRSARTEPAKRS